MLTGPLTEAELATAILCESVSEAAAAGQPVAPAPPGDVVREDGTVKMAIIRPCISRGRLIRGLSPIYTPTMLREHSGVFTNWPMFRDHAVVIAESDEAREVYEQEADARREMFEAICESWQSTEERLTEAVKKVGRSIDDLAGRVTRSWWEPDTVFEDDATFGYQPGAVTGLGLLLPSVREKVAADVGLMHTSINGYPTGGRPGPVPWQTARRGMVIEGIRKVPMGSVDVVVRGGAGGRFLPSPKKPAAKPLGEREVSSPESGYASPQMAGIELSNATSADQLRAYVAENAPQLLTVLREGTAATPAAPAGGDDKPLTRAELAESMREAQESFAKTLAEQAEQSKTERDAAIAAERQASVFETEAHKLIEAAAKARGGFLTGSWVADLKARYTILPSGPASGLLVEATDDKPAIEALRENVKDDIEYARKLIAEAAGQPVVRAQGAAAPGTAPTGQQTSSSWAEDLGLTEKQEDGSVKIDDGIFESMVG